MRGTSILLTLEHKLNPDLLLKLEITTANLSAVVIYQWAIDLLVAFMYDISLHIRGLNLAHNRSKIWAAFW